MTKKILGCPTFKRSSHLLVTNKSRPIQDIPYAAKITGMGLRRQWGGLGQGKGVQIFVWTTFKHTCLKKKLKNWSRRTCLVYRGPKRRVTQQAPTRFWGPFGGFWGSRRGQDGQILKIRVSNESLIVRDCNSTKKKIGGVTQFFRVLDLLTGVPRGSGGVMGNFFSSKSFFWPKMNPWA